MENDSLKVMQRQLEDYIGKNYDSVEEFCWDKGLNKATISNFLRGKKDFQISTLERIAKALGKKLVIQAK